MKCGCCDWACPSSIPLTDYFRFAQAFKQNSETRAAQARLAEQRHQQRQARQTARKQKRKLDIEQRKTRLHNRSHDKTTATPAKDRPQATVGNNSEDSVECTTDTDLISATLNRIKQQRIAQANNRK
jgi:electron transport complex protein RnfC